MSLISWEDVVVDRITRIVVISLLRTHTVHIRMCIQAWRQDLEQEGL